MPHTHICCLMHVVFSTAERRSQIREPMQSRLYEYLCGIARENRFKILVVGGVSDHIHLLLSLPGTTPVSKAVQLIKGGSSKWIHDTFPEHRLFSWQEGFGAFSVSISQQARTERYIRSQPEHHKKISFTDEFKKLLALHGIAEE
jgi:putative transposase